MTITKHTEYDHMVSSDGLINVRKITVYVDGEQEINRKYHRKVVDPTEDDLSNEDHRTRVLGAALSSELAEIKAGLADAEVVSEGETVEGEELKKQTWLNKLSEFWSKLE